MGKSSQRLTKKAYQARLRRLRENLLQMQVLLKETPFKVLVLLAGPEGAGRGDLLHSLTGWLDPRGVETFSYHAPTEEERERPLQWRFWRSLPALGRIGLYAGSWYTETLREVARGRRERTELKREAERIREFEQCLADGGTLVVKVWLDLSKAAQGRRLRALESEPDTAWRVTDEEWHHHRMYDRLKKTARFIRQETDRPGARWTTIDAEDERLRDLAVGELLLARFHQQRRKIARLPRPRRPARLEPLRPSGLRRLHALPLDQVMSEQDYESLRGKWLGRLNRAVRAALQARRSLVFAFEGWDAAGKGGAIRRLTSALDPRDYTVIPVAKPTEEEKRFHYLWRFWKHVPRDGRVAIFDRSWYGRVLVERIEGFCREDEWRRAFGEINDFERQLTEHGAIVLKYWLHISHEEQLRRFRDREETPHKQHKINAEDWRNRKKRRDYEVAVGDMLALTAPENAPWHVIPADNKRFARLEVLRSASKQIEAALEESGGPVLN
jgi:polyphosphate:AMP phosphotransferase